MLTVYVDGTYLDGKWGGGFCVYEDNTLIYQDCGIGEDIPELNSMRNISGEMMACMRATEWIHKQNKKGVIVHDYIGLSKWVTGEWNTSKYYTQKYKEYMKYFYDNGIISFKWVKGHEGVEGNEIADKLARQAIIYNKQWNF